MEHTNGAESQEKIGRNADNDNPSVAEGINGLRTKDMILIQTQIHTNITSKSSTTISYPN